MGGTSYSYDAVGNVTAKGAQGFVYNAAAQMEEATLSAVTVGEYVYNAYNQRTSKTVSGVTTHYVYGPGGMLYGEYDSSGNLIREYIYVNGAPVAQIDAGSPESILYLHTDHLLTPRYATDSTGATVWSWDSGAFGAEAPTGSATVNLRFPGQYYDAETGLHYNWHRYYDPATGRYITSDPLGLAEGLNTYSYAAQNPLSYIDPDGQLPFIPILVAVSAWLSGVAFTGTIHDIIKWWNNDITCQQFWWNFAWNWGLPAALRGIAGALKAIPKIAGAIGRISASARKTYWIRFGGPKEMHHATPREILKSLPPKVANHPSVRGKRGAPNRWPVPQKKHRQIHRGAGGGKYNDDWKERLKDLGREPTVEDILNIREDIAKEHGIDIFKP